MTTLCWPKQGSILKNGAEWRESARARAFGTPERGSILQQQRYGVGDRNDPRGQSLTNEANPSQFLLRQQPPIKADLNYGKPQQPHSVLPHDMAGETTASGDSYELTPLPSQQPHHNNAMSGSRSGHFKAFFSHLPAPGKIMLLIPREDKSNEWHLIFFYFRVPNRRHGSKRESISGLELQQ